MGTGDGGDFWERTTEEKEKWEKEKEKRERETAQEKRPNSKRETGRDRETERWVVLDRSIFVWGDSV